MSQSNHPANQSENDWRLQFFTQLAEDWRNPWTGQLVPKGARVTQSSIIQLTKKKCLTIPLPNATALLLNASTKAFAEARTIRSESGIDKSIQAGVSFANDETAFDYIERMMEAIVLAFTALEAFVNEAIPQDFIYPRFVQSAVILEPTKKDEIERYVPIDEKLSSVLPEILKCPSPKGSRCWQGYKSLKETRDRIVHMKTKDRKSSGPEVDTIWKAIFTTPAPHITVKAVIDHFAKHMKSKPIWHILYPHQT